MNPPTPPAASRISDPQRIRALAHPLRIDLLELLGEGEATATQCAEATGESVASCSFHLRTLAKYGYIEPGEQRGREKPWRLVERERTFTPDWDDPSSVRAVKEFAAFEVEREAQRIIDWIDRARDVPQEWIEATTISQASSWATRDELEHISRTLATLFEPLRDRWDDPSLRPEGSRPVRLFAVTSIDEPRLDRATQPDTRP